MGRKGGLIPLRLSFTPLHLGAQLLARRGLLQVLTASMEAPARP